MTNNEMNRLTQRGLTALVLGLILLIGVSAYALAHQQGGSIIDNALKVASLIGGIIFFAYKVASGSFASSTSMTLSVSPHLISETAWGAASLVLERGEHYSVEIREIYLVVEETGAKTQVPFKSPTREAYYLSPQETARYGIWIPLNKGERATITAIAVVQQQYFKFIPASHVYASTVVLAAAST